MNFYKKQKSLIIFGFIVVLTTLAITSQYISNDLEIKNINKEAKIIAETDEICNIEEADSLFVGCNNFF